MLDVKISFLFMLLFVLYDCLKISQKSNFHDKIGKEQQTHLISKDRNSDMIIFIKNKDFSASHCPKGSVWSQISRKCLECYIINKSLNYDKNSQTYFCTCQPPYKQFKNQKGVLVCQKYDHTCNSGELWDFFQRKCISCKDKPRQTVRRNQNDEVYCSCQKPFQKVTNKNGESLCSCPLNYGWNQTLRKCITCQSANQTLYIDQQTETMVCLCQPPFQYVSILQKEQKSQKNINTNKSVKFKNKVCKKVQHKCQDQQNYYWSFNKTKCIQLPICSSSSSKNSLKIQQNKTYEWDKQLQKCVQKQLNNSIRIKTHNSHSVLIQATNSNNPLQQKKTLNNRGLYIACCIFTSIALLWNSILLSILILKRIYQGFYFLSVFGFLISLFALLLLILCLSNNHQVLKKWQYLIILLKLIVHIYQLFNGYTQKSKIFHPCVQILLFIIILTQFTLSITIIFIGVVI